MLRLFVAILLAIAIAAPTAIAQDANSGGSEYLPSVPGAGGPEREESFDLSAATGADGSAAEAAREDVLAGAGGTLIGWAFPVLLAVALVVAIATTYRRMRIAT